MYTETLVLNRFSVSLISDFDNYKNYFPTKPFGQIPGYNDDIDVFKDKKNLKSINSISLFQSLGKTIQPQCYIMYKIYFHQ